MAVSPVFTGRLPRIKEGIQRSKTGTLGVPPMGFGVASATAGVDRSPSILGRLSARLLSDPSSI